MSRIVVALGGNAIQHNGGASADEQKAEVALTARKLAPLICDGHQIVIVHGNGPQVGDILLHEEAIDTPDLPTNPLDTCVAMSQGMIGYWLQQAIDNELRSLKFETKITTILTQVLVDANDSAFENPSKPIGPFYETEQEAQTIADKRGFIVKPDSDRGWRRVVPSPRPIDIIESDVINDLISQNRIVITAGGGGIPVVERNGQLTGVEAVIDKDASAAVVADIIGADLLLVLTTVDSVKIHFDQPDESSLGRISCEEITRYTEEGEFAVGSMLPKVQAVVHFVERGHGRRRGIIASLDEKKDFLGGGVGTEVF